MWLWRGTSVHEGFPLMDGLIELPGEWVSFLECGFLKQGHIMWFVFFKQLFTLLSFITTWSSPGVHQKPPRCQPCLRTSKITSYINQVLTKCLDSGTRDNNKKQAKGLTEVILQNGCSREKEGSEPENTQRSSCFWKIQTVYQLEGCLVHLGDM